MKRGAGPIKRSAGALLSLVVAAALILSACTTFFDSDETQGEPDLVIAARATLTHREMQREPTATPTARPLVATSTPTAVEASFACEADPLIAGLPPGLPPTSPSNHNWYGNSEAGLWASPFDFGYFLSDDAGEAESLWFAGKVTPVLWYGTIQPVEVTASKLDGSVTVEQVQSRDMLMETQWTDILFPEPGCWELTAGTEASSLTLTVEVLPIGQRADYHLIQTIFESLPYEAPASCPVTPLVGPDARDESDNFAHYWLEADGISVDVGGWFIAGEQQSMGVHGEGVIDNLTAAIRGLEPGMRPEMPISTLIFHADARVASFIFPEPGCWEMEFATLSSTATFVVYVYPRECTPVDGGFAGICEPPTS